MTLGYFSWHRFWAIIVKEFIQMRRDRLTFLMMIGVPLLQLILFGYAINADPKYLPTAVLTNDHGVFSRTLISAMQNSNYFRVVKLISTEQEAAELLDSGDVLFVINIPTDFERKLIKGEDPAVLLEADATDPGTTSNAVAAMQVITAMAIERDLKGAISDSQELKPAVELRVHRKYNPEAVTQYNIVPGLMGVVLTMTMVMITALAITREREKGTMENLLATPVQPLEVMIGKIVPYIVVGYVQVVVILIAARTLFDVPMIGNVFMLLVTSLVFIAANLSVGVTFSTMAANQLQALQMSVFFFLPSILLSGFMFPFAGMPQWAQNIGSLLPLTHFLRIVRGVLLKGNGLEELMIHLWPIILFWIVIMALGVQRYKKTLD